MRDVPTLASVVTPSRRAILGFLALLPNAACGERTIAVGGARFRVVSSGAGSRCYIHIHGNERTARDVLSQHVQSRAGAAFLVQGDERNVNTGGLLLDPNRMFSRVGARANLEKLNPNATPEAIGAALDTLDRELPAFLQEALPPDGGLLIAIHNNSEGYNIHTEIPISEEHHLPKPDAPNDFFLATNARDYAVLAASLYNAVLQVKPSTTDDGSLSRLCASRGIRYVNLECYLGRTEIQREMLTWLDAALP